MRFFVLVFGRFEVHVRSGGCIPDVEGNRASVLALFSPRSNGIILEFKCRLDLKDVYVHVQDLQASAQLIMLSTCASHRGTT